MLLETAGTIDLDVEIKFTINNVPQSIDIHKRFINEIKDLYKALHAISLEQKSNATKLDYAKEGLTLAAQALGRTSSQNATPAQSFEDITRFAAGWLEANKDEYKRKDFGEVFEKYINN